MLDIEYYRNEEKIAKNEICDWRSYSKFNLNIFEKFGFIVRADSTNQLFALLDSMQEDRFSRYVREIPVSAGGGDY